MNFTRTIAPTDEAVMAARAHIARIGRMLYERHLTDAAGGNISVRVENLICISPRYSGSKRQWQLEPEDVLVTDFDRTILLGSGQISRESNVHFKLHSEFGEWGTAVIHAHSRNLLVFAALERPLPPFLEATRKFGETPCVPFAPAHSPRLAENIAATMRGRESRIKTQAAAAIAPWHGLFLMGKDLNAAYDAVERMDTNAYLIIMSQMLAGSEAVAASLKRMEDLIGNYKE